MVWPIGMAGNVEVGQIVDYAWRENATLVYLLTAPGPGYVTQLTKYFTEAAALDHVTIVGQSTVPLTGVDLNALAAAIRKAQPRAVFTPIFSPYVEPILAGLRERGIVIPFYATDGADAGLKPASFGTALDNDMIFTSFGFPRPSSRQFFIDYRATFQKSASGGFPLLGFETIGVLDSAVLAANAITPDAINAAFAKGFTHTGVALADITYPGRGVRLPVTAAGVTRIIGGVSTPMFASYPVGVVPIPSP